MAILLSIDIHVTQSAPSVAHGLNIEADDLNKWETGKTPAALSEL